GANIHLGPNRSIATGSDEIARALSTASERTNIPLSDLFRAGRHIAQGVRYARSIDSYIHTHRHDKAIKVCAKIAIVSRIVDHERRSSVFIDASKGIKKFQDDKKVRVSWLHDLMHLLHQGLMAAENLDQLFQNVTIVNFNYDRCIEQFLWLAIQE